MPGLFYLHFDGLMEEALKRLPKLARVLNRVEQSQTGGEHTEPLLVNVLGTLNNAASLMLTEMDHEHVWERMAHASSDVVDLVRQMGRSLLFLGVSPRDMLVRRLICLLETGEASMQGPCFFVSREATEVDASYWKPFNVLWIREDPVTVIEAAHRADGGGGQVMSDTAPADPAAVPFKYLDHFQEAEHDLFAGREDEIQEVLTGVSRGRDYT